MRCEPPKTARRANHVEQIFAPGDSDLVIALENGDLRIFFCNEAHLHVGGNSAQLRRALLASEPPSRWSAGLKRTAKNAPRGLHVGLCECPLLAENGHRAWVSAFDPKRTFATMLSHKEAIGELG
jgi:hypothetical protein